jgi:hypothetical protein
MSKNWDRNLSHSKTFRFCNQINSWSKIWQFKQNNNIFSWKCKIQNVSVHSHCHISRKRYLPWYPMWRLSFFRHKWTFLSISHDHACSAMCDLRCIFRTKRWVNLFLHNLHEICRSPLCTLRWFFRIYLLAKVSLYPSQEKGLSPLCILRCV